MFQVIANWIKSLSGYGLRAVFKSLRQYKESQGESEILMSALAAMQDKNTHLENSLSAETRLKLDLFSALGEAKREIEILKSLVQKKEFEIKDIKSRMAETMALLPSTNTYNGLGSTDSSPLFSSKFAKEDVIVKSNLNPHAKDYAPKTTI